MKLSSRKLRTRSVLIAASLALAFLPGSLRANSGIFKDLIFIDKGSGTETYQLHGSNIASWGGLNLGSFDAATGTLTLKGFEVNTFQDSGDDINTALGEWTIYKQGSSVPGFNEVNIPYISSSGNNKFWQTTTRSDNVLAGPLDVGTYNFRVYTKAYGSPNAYTIYSNNGGNDYIATFTINASNFTYSGASGGTTGSGTDWTNGRQPGNGHNLFFGSTGTTALTNTLSSANSLTFNSGAGAFTISGGTLSVAAGVTNSSSNLQTINSNFTLSAAQTFNATSAGLTFGGTIETAGKTVTVNGNNNTSFAQLNNSPGTNTGAASIIKNGTGTLTLIGTADNLNMSALVNAGTLVLAKTNSGPGGLTSGVRSLGSGLTIAGGTAQLGGTGQGGSTTTTDQLYDGSGVTVTSGAFDVNDRSETISTLSLAGTGITNAGALLNSGSGAATLTVTNGTTLTANSTIGVTNSTAGLSLNTAIGGSTFGITKVGAGTLTLSGSTANTYTGLTTVSAGELDLNKSVANGAIAGDADTTTTDITVSGGTLKWLGSEQVGNTATILLSSGTVDLSGKTETLGTFKNTGGIFVTGVNGHLKGTTATIDWSGGTNTVNAGALVEDNHIKIGGGTNTVEGKGVTAAATGGVLQLNTAGAGMEMTGGTLLLNADNTSAGTLKFVGTPGNLTAHASATTSFINTSGAGSIAGTIDLGSPTRTFDVETGAATIGLSISASITNGGLNKVGTGTLELLGSNTYVGGTVVNGGKIIAGAAGALGGNGAITVNSTGSVILAGAGNLDRVNNGAGVALAGGTFGISPTGNGANAVNEGSGTHSVGGAVQSGTSAVGIGALTMSASSTLDFGASGVGTLVFDSFSRSAGTLNITNFTSLADVASQTSGTDGLDDRLIFHQDQALAGNLGFFNFGSGLTAAEIALGNGYFEITAVPETSTWVMGALAFVALLASRRGQSSRKLLKKALLNIF